MGLRERPTNADQIRDRAKQDACGDDGQSFDQWGKPFHTDRLSIYQLAERYSVKPATIWNWHRKGKLPEGFLLRGRRFWLTSDILKWENDR